MIDLDLRNPSVEKVLGIKSKVHTGVVDVLKGKKSLTEELRVIKKWNLSVLFAGESQNNPLSLMHRDKLGRMISELKNVSIMWYWIRRRWLYFPMLRQLRPMQTAPFMW